MWLIRNSAKCNTAHNFCLVTIYRLSNNQVWAYSREKNETKH